MARSLKPVAYLASGGGSTVAAALNAEKSGDLHGVSCRLVIVSKPDAGVIQKALNAGIPQRDIVVLRRREFADETSFGDAIIDLCARRSIELICQFGWLPHTPANVTDAYRGHIMNQHPGALDPTHATLANPHPDFGGRGMHGLATIAAAMFFARLAGRNVPLEATTHHVVDKTDGGNIIARGTFYPKPGETPVDAQKRFIRVEHGVQLWVLRHWGRYGTLPSWRRRAPLIYADELPLLAQAKQQALDYVREQQRAV